MTSGPPALPPPQDPLADLSPDAAQWHHAGGVLDCRRGHLIGIVNATPDSFTDEGRHFGTEAAVAHGHALARAGASVVEVGGESLRFSEHTPVDEEIARVVPVVRRLARELSVPVAVDTFKAPVARAALAEGAVILNDPTGLRDPQMAEVAAAAGAGVVLTHFFGPPKVRPTSFPEGDVVAAIRAWADTALDAAAAAGIPRSHTVIDPGVGLGTSPPQDLDLLHRIDEMRACGRPVFVPISHKKVLGAVTGLVARERLAPTAAGLAWCRIRGASLFRVHDVEFLRHTLTAIEAMLCGAPDTWFEVVK